MSMFDKILIANRGEIACRVIKTARKMGIATVAVYSDADADALHVRMADEAVHIGGSASSESYLVIPNILAAIEQTGAQAVHPGFGFLSENSTFADALAAAGVTFIGPGNLAIQAMGDKIESKKLAIQAGVSCIPGHTAAIADADEALRISAKIGCPVMLKASAGGGGKGMRVAWTLDEVRDNFISAQNEARSAFGDDRVFVEKFIESPRHIEIQVLADSHGNTLYLNERECSIQRRHQKVIEEAPSPFIDPATRKAMGEQAVALARAVEYKSAGTVEFIVDKERNFYFLEMNTRLQVEHPVTEFITGLDLVEQMIRVAAGEPLAFAQQDVQLKGWSMECRVYAEDPDRNFMPSTGRLTRYLPPEENDCVRVDTGVFEGGEISMFYDPMIAKLVSYGETRDEAAAKMNDALDAYTIRGVQHNIPFLAALMRHPKFIEGDMTTGFIDEHYPEGFASSDVVHSDPTLLVAVAAKIQHQVDLRAARITGQTGGGVSEEHHYVATVGDREYPLNIEDTGSASLVEIDGVCYRIEYDWKPGAIRFYGKANGLAFTMQVDREGIGWRLTHNGTVNHIRVLSRRIAELNRLMPVKAPPDLSRFLLSPMPGLLVRVSVAEGEKIEPGQELAVVEAMKMENVLTAAQGGVVAAIRAAAGDSLAVDQVIIEFE